VSSASNAGLPPDAVHAGHDADGSPIFVGRAYHEGDQLPAKVIPSKQVAYICHGGQEIAKHLFEVLTGTGFTWESSDHGEVPAGAVSTGSQSDGEPLFIGRAHFQGSLTPGKVHPSHGCLYIPFGGAEQRVQQYEVLVAPVRSSWVATSAYGDLPEGAILAGNDADGTEIYVGRAFHEGDQLPAKVMPSKQVAYVAYGGQEIAKHQYEVLCNGNVEWVHSGHGSIPSNAVIGGQTSNGETLYVGRTHHEGSLTPGKVHPSHGSLYIPFGGAEVSFNNYEILIEN